jgi:hypothetical protein
MFQSSQRPHWVWYQILLRHSSKMAAWTALWGLAFSLLPGTTILVLRSLNYPFATPKLLIWGCNIRKHVGLISLFFLFWHACLMLLLFGEEYFGFLLREVTWKFEASMLMAMFSTAFFFITGIASIPSVQAGMNKAHFHVVFGIVVWVALLFGFLHVLFLGMDTWMEDKEDRSPYSWARDMPPITLMASLIPLLTMFLKTVHVSLALLFWVKNSFKVRLGLASVSTHNDDEAVSEGSDEKV